MQVAIAGGRGAGAPAERAIQKLKARRVAQTHGVPRKYTDAFGEEAGLQRGGLQRPISGLAQREATAELRRDRREHPGAGAARCVHAPVATWACVTAPRGLAPDGDHQRP